MSSPGEIHAGAFVMPIRVYYGDTDAGGIVYHAQYLAMAERCRTEMLRAFDWPLVGKGGENFVVRSAQLVWRMPAYLDDLLRCSTTVERLGAASVHLSQRFTREAAPVCDVAVELVYVSSQMKPTRLPGPLRAAFAELCG